MEEYSQTIENGKIKDKHDADYWMSLESKQYEAIGWSFDDIEDSNISNNAMSESDVNTYKILTEASLNIDNDQINIIYDESKMSGLDNTSTQISFNLKNPLLVSITRSGEITSTLIIENKIRHICAYDTPLGNFEISTYGHNITNSITLKGGTLYLDYIVEIHGSMAEHTILKIRLKKKQ